MQISDHSEGGTIVCNPWYAVRVRTRSELLADQMLRGKGYETFLPTYQTRRVWSDRVKQLELPLYPGYVFCRFDFDNRLPILQSVGVMDIVNDGRKGLTIPDDEILAVRRIMDSRLKVGPFPYLHAGQTVEIHKGPLRGIEGILVVQKKNFRLVVSIPLLQRSVNVEIEGDWVRPVGGVTNKGTNLYRA